MHAEGCCRCAPRNDAPLPRLRRIFAGTPEQMYVSLNEKLATLPHDTQVLVPAWRSYPTQPYPMLAPAGRRRAYPSDARRSCISYIEGCVPASERAPVAERCIM